MATRIELTSGAFDVAGAVDTGPAATPFRYESPIDGAATRAKALPDAGLLEAELDIVPAMGGPRSAYLHRLLAVADVGAGAIGGLVGSLVGGLPLASAAAVGGICAVLWPLVAFICGLYSAGDLRSWVSGVPDMRWLLFIALAVSWPLHATAGWLGSTTPGRAALVASLVTFVVSVCGRAGARGIAHASERLRERTLIVGSGVVAAEVADKLRTHTEAGLIPVGIIDDEVHEAIGLDLPCLGSLGELGEVIAGHRVDRVIIAFTQASHQQLLNVIRTCRDDRVPVHVVPRLYEFLDGARELDNVGGLPLISLGVPRLSTVSHAAKRALDVVVSFATMVLAAPAFAAIALAIKLESPGPVFFRQVRVGRGGERFELLKFRSMYNGADARKSELLAVNDVQDGVMFKIYEDPRVTPVGAFLRRYSLDEFPQMVNVLRGQMSLVGPRPLVVPEADALAEQWHRRRQDLRPGLTGPWQIYGRSTIPFHDMVRLDYQYVANWSLGRDFQILLATAPAVLSGRGAY